MAIVWTETAYRDLERLYEFLAAVDPAATGRQIQALTIAPETLLTTSAIGQILPQYAPRNVRRLLVARYEMRYEIVGHDVMILTIWHQRELR